MAKILLIDDEPSVYKVADLILSRAGHEVKWARDGIEAMSMMNAGQPPDLVLCDIMMPRMDGHQVVGAIQQDPRLQHLPVVMLTSSRRAKDVTWARKIGAAGYIIKPFRAGDLLKQVSRHVKPESVFIDK